LVAVALPWRYNVEMGTANSLHARFGVQRV